MSEEDDETVGNRAGNGLGTKTPGVDGGDDGNVEMIAGAGCCGEKSAAAGSCVRMDGAKAEKEAVGTTLQGRDLVLALANKFSPYCLLLYAV